MDSSLNSSSFRAGGLRSNFTHRPYFYYSDYDWTGIKCPMHPWYRYYVGGIATTVLCTIAIFGNIVCFIVLSRPVMKSSVNFLLLGICCSDLVHVTVTLLLRGIQRICEHHCVGMVYTFWIRPISAPYLLPFGTTAQVASIYLTVLLGVERYVAVCQPFKAKIWFSRRKSSLFCVGVVLFSLLYNLPVWFELNTLAKFNHNQFLGLTVRATALYRNPTYVSYYVNWAYFIVIRLVPFTLLTVLNGFICRAVYRMNKTRQALTHLQCHEVSVAPTLLCIVVISLSNLATIGSIMLEAFGVLEHNALNSASNFLALLIAALNFIIYCFMSRNFRKVLLLLLGANSTQTNLTN